MSFSFSPVQLHLGMAEVAGLVIGGISLAGLFDHCITIVKCFDSAASCDDDFQDAALMLTLLGGRLSRWEQSLRDNISIRTTEEDGEHAELWLKQIRKRLQDAEKVGSRYETRPATNTTPSDRSNEVSRMLAHLRKVLKQEATISLAKKARWALFDQEKMTVLVDKLDKLIGSLEVLFSSLHDRRAELAKVEAAEVLQTQEFGGTLHALEALRIAATKVDRDLDAAAASSSHTYRDIDITEKAIVVTGDYYSEEWTSSRGPIARGGSHLYESIRISGESSVNVGNVYGGKSAIEIRRT